jgi:hypothetical protein
MPITTPSLAQAVASHEHALRQRDGPVGLRAFGQQAIDLEHDFEAEDRPTLVTALLATCSVGSAAEFWYRHWWQAPVGTRIAAVLDLMLLSTPARPASSLTVSLRCEQVDCGARFDIELPALAWAQADVPDTPVKVARDGSEPLLLRRPTGSDLSDFRSFALQNADSAYIAQALLQRLCLAGTPQPEDAEQAAAALAEADPLVAFAVHCACPECGTAKDRAIDLEAQALQGLALRQRALMREVHRLASHYGWTEREIFEVPASRRSRYLEAIAAAAEDAGR